MSMQKKGIPLNQIKQDVGSSGLVSGSQVQQYRSATPVKAENPPQMALSKTSPIKNVLTKAREAHHNSNPMIESRVKNYKQNDPITMNLHGSKSSVSHSRVSSESENKSAFSQFVTSIMSPKKIRLPLPQIF